MPRRSHRAAKALLSLGAPVNLAMLRIAVPIIVLSTPELRDAVHWSTLLRPDLQVPPRGSAWLFTTVPVTPALARVAVIALVLACLSATLGLFSRAALAIAALTSLYVLGIPQLGGTVTHNHHLVWLLTLLAASPSGDAFSLDAAVAAYRSPGTLTLHHNLPLRARSAITFALPILVAWALIGLIFFFPGFWKLRTSGTAWIWSDNLRNQMYWKWYETGGAPPRLRIDGYPVVCHLGALAAVVFELTFGILVFIPRLRAGAVAAALGFHALTATLMRITFPSLWHCYGVFVRWDRALPRLGRWMFDEPLVVRYSGPGSRLEGLIAALRATDVLKRVVYRAEGSEGSPESGIEAFRAIPGVGEPPALPHVHLHGWAALLAIGARSPALWPALPLLFLATRSRWRFDILHVPRITRPRPAPRRRSWPPVLVGAALIAGALRTGSLNLQHAWPFACYPTFQWTAPAQIPALMIEATLPDGTIVEIPRASALDAANGQKLWGMEWSLSGVTGAPDPARLRAYLRVLAAQRGDLDATIRKARTVRFYRGFFSVIPGDRGQPPLRRVLLAELTPSPEQSALPAPRSPAP